MKTIINYVGILGLLLSSQVFCATRPAAQVNVKSGNVAGEIFNSVGKRVRDLNLTVVDTSNNKVVSELTTDELGSYTIENLKRGHYILKVGDKVAYEMNVFDGYGASSLKFVLSDGYAAGFMEQIPLANWAGGVFGTSAQTGGIIILSTAAIAGGGAAIIANNEGGGSSSSDTVSPP